MWADLDGSNALTTRYFRGDPADDLFARIGGTGGTAYWYLTDRLGSIRDVIDNTALATVKDHLNQTGTFLQSQNTLGISGLRQLQGDLGAHFGVDTIEITTRIGRSTGQTGGFGPGVFRIR